VPRLEKGTQREWPRAGNPRKSCRWGLEETVTDRTAQVLSLHRITPRCYDLTSVRTGSVRDQLIRATLLADALHESRLVDAQAPLLVMGAGVAGVALGLAAAHRGINVTVVEKRLDPFWTLRWCSWRTVDPTEYDWPHPHWQYGRLPMSGRPAALSGRNPPVKIELLLRPSRWDGAGLAAVWSRRYGSVLLPTPRGTRKPVGSGSLCVLYDKNANDLTIDDTAAASALARRTGGALPMSNPSTAAATALVKVTAPWAGWSSPMSFGAVVSCIGFGDEITAERPAPGRSPTWNGFTGHRFWFDPDGMQPSGFLAGGGGATPTAILISGAGDGAMQDFQRAATGLFGRPLYEEIGKHVRFTPEPYMKDAILTEDRARRAHGWQPAGFLIPSVLADWHDAYENAVLEVWNGWDMAEQTAVADAVLRPELCTYLRNGEGVRVLWVMREATPGFVYGLNRFLSLLILRLIDRLNARPAGPPVGLLCEHEITAIRPAVATHVCGNPATCYSQQHGVDLTPVGALAGLPLLRDRFDLILVRHGQEPTPLLGGASVPEQQVPFDLPH